MGWGRIFLPDWNSSRLQRRFALISGLLLTGVSLLFLLLLSQIYRGQMIQGYARASLQVSQLLESTLENAMIKRDLDGLQAIVADMATLDGIQKVRITDPTGEVRFSSAPDLLHRQMNDPMLAEALTQQSIQSDFRVLSDGARVWRTINPVANQPRCASCHGPVASNPVNGLLIVDTEAVGLSAALWQGVALLGALGIMVILSVQAGLWISVRALVLNPVNELDKVAQKLAAGDLDARAPAGGDDELARLGSSVNTMARELQGSITALSDQRAFLQHLVDAIPDGVRVIAPDFRTLLVNRAFRDMHGIAHDEEIAGLPCHALSHGRETPCVPTMVRCPVEELRRGTARDLTTSHIHKSGSGNGLRVEVSAVRVPMMIEGREQLCVIESIRDLDIQSSISQEQRLSEMGMLATGVAHEVYNPLASLNLVLEALSAQDLDAEGRGNLELAHSEIEKCRRVTESLLRLAAPAPEGQLPMPLALRPILEDTARLLGFESEKRGVTFAIEAEGDDRLLGLESDLRMLVFNLAQNAVHAMPEGGTITLGLTRKHDCLQLSVADQGIGIARQDLERIMMPFWTRRGDGTEGRGLGLPICHGIVSRMGGRIEVKSAPGQGSVFTAFLPVGDAHDSQ